MGGTPKWMVYIWFIMEHLIKVDDLRVPSFLETYDISVGFWHSPRMPSTDHSNHFVDLLLESSVVG